MVDVAVALPEPRPGDDEDVVWGLSTAAALWARGERGDAIVWLRRAADAAASAGQEARAGELQVDAARLEQVPEQPRVMMPPPPTAARATAETLPQDLLEPEPEEEDEAPPAAEPAPPAVEAPPEPAAPLPPPPAPPPPAPPPPAPPPPPPAVAPPASRAAPPPSTARTPTITPPPPAVAPPSRAAQPPPSTARTPTITPPPPAVAPPSRAAQPPPSTTRTATITPPPPAVARTPSVAPPAPVAPQPPAPRGPLPSYTAYVATQPKTATRAPILDPWADEPTLPSIRIDSALRAVQLEGDEVMVQLRRNQPRFVEDDDGVFTSAAPIETTLRRAAPRPPTPPARKWTATGEQPPGYIAEVGSVPSKAPVPSRARPSTPSAPASDAGKPAPPSTPPGPRPPTAPPPRSPSAPPAHVEPLDGPTLPSTPSAINAPTLPATASTIPRSRPMTMPPPAAPTLPVVPRVPAPSPIRVPSPPSAPASSPSAPASVRPPPASTSVKGPVVPRAPAPAGSPASAHPRPISVPAPARPPELVLDEVEAFADLSAEMRQHLVSLARLEALAADDEVSAFGAALVLEGEAAVCATIVDAHAAQAAPGALIPVRGTLAEGVALRVVAGAGGARVAVWEAAAVEEALRSCPWVLEDLVARADKLQAFAGATMGPLGELDDVARGRLLPRFSVRVAPPRDVILDEGAPVPGVILVCVGAIELAGGGLVRAGEVLFAAAALDGAPAPSVARASASGAVLLVADRALSAELAAASPLAALLAR